MLARRRALDAEVAGQAERAHAVDQAEVDHLGVAALFAGDLGRARRRRLRRRWRGGCPRRAAKARQQALVARNVRHDAQLDLRIIGRHDQAARRGDESFADAAAFGGAHRDVLQIGIVRGQPAGHRHRLRIVGVHAAGARIDHLRQLVGIGGFQLGQAAIVQQRPAAADSPRPAWPALPRRWTARRSAVFLTTGKLQLVEQDFAQLLGRIQVERLARQFVGRCSSSSMLCAESHGLRGQHVGVDAARRCARSSAAPASRHFDVRR